ncbi:MAG TPA: DUF1579 domain-containing protein, partial [Planctomycetota bacterium]|nr:DUF1579 domain-containing protein [Planctomycetota bacterium]
TRAEIDAQIAEAPLEQATAQDAELEHSVLGDPTVEKARAAKLDEQLDQTETEAVDYAEASAPKPVDEISPEMDMAALQARMLELATPGPEHQVLNSLEGKFQAAVKLWMSPEADPLLSVGSMQSSWALGGRFLEGHFAGEMMGQPFYGFGHMGYDKVRESYVGYWVDSMGTQMMNISTGQMSPDRKTLTLGRTILDPLTGKEQPMKEVLTFVDQDHHEWDMWGFSPDGTWYRMLHIDYTRMP